MGNSLRSCCRESSEDDECCFCCMGQKRGLVKGEKMVPADLHSSSAQDGCAVKRRPKTLPTSTTPAASTSEVQSQTKIAEFSLHGVQKTSPAELPEMYVEIAETGIVMDSISAFFDKYKDGNREEILEEGIVKFCKDLQVDPASFIVLALAWKFKAATMCKFTREEFVQGCLALQVDSITSIKESFSRLEQESMNNFKDIYKFAFQFGLDSDLGQRSLPTDVAVGMWQVIFSNNPPFLLEDWLKYLEESQVRGISRDTWNMFLHFTEIIGSDLSVYDDNEAWPSLFDDFVEYCRSRKETVTSEAERQNSAHERSEHAKMQLVSLEQLERLETCHPLQYASEEKKLSLGSPDNISGVENEVALTMADDIGASENSPVESTSVTKEQPSECDAELICCETLHSSH